MQQWESWIYWFFICFSVTSPKPWVKLLSWFDFPNSRSILQNRRENVLNCNFVRLPINGERTFACRPATGYGCSFQSKCLRNLRTVQNGHRDQFGSESEEKADSRWPVWGNGLRLVFQPVKDVKKFSDHCIEITDNRSRIYIDSFSEAASFKIITFKSWWSIKLFMS